MHICFCFFWLSHLKHIVLWISTNHLLVESMWQRSACWHHLLRLYFFTLTYWARIFSPWPSLLVAILTSIWTEKKRPSVINPTNKSYREQHGPFLWLLCLHRMAVNSLHIRQTWRAFELFFWPPDAFNSTLSHSWSLSPWGRGRCLFGEHLCPMFGAEGGINQPLLL